jgi:hypothetical protein
MNLFPVPTADRKTSRNHTGRYDYVRIRRGRALNLLFLVVRARDDDAARKKQGEKD